MFFLLSLSLLLIQRSNAYIKGAYSAVTCANQPVWELSIDDNRNMSARFQNWVGYAQNACVKTRQKEYWMASQEYGGIGSYLTGSVINLIKALEIGHIYEPWGKFKFAYANASMCSRGLITVDCFSVPPLTNCNPPHIQANPITEYPPHIDPVDAESFMKNSDICTYGKVTKKTILWVLGQLYLYHMRLMQSLEIRFSAEWKRIIKLLNSVPPSVPSNKCLTAAIQVRTGMPDGNRRSFDGKEHFAALQSMNEKLLLEKKEICAVYVATGDPNATVFANISVNKPTLLGGFHFLMVPRFIGDPKLEMEWQIGQWKMDPNFDAANVYLEYLVDIKIMSEANIFYGSHSNVVVVVSSLRAALHPEYLNSHTCFLDSHHAHSANLHPVCLDSWDMLRFYQAAMKGFDGGAIFFPDTMKCT